MKTSKYKGVFLTTETNKYGKKYQYWVASLYVNKVRYVKRCTDELRAAKEYDNMRRQFRMYAVNFPDAFERQFKALSC